MEFLSASAVITSSLLYWLGGQEIPIVNRGYLFVRRYVLPIVLAGFLIATGGLWWKVIIACTLLCGSLHLGYKSSLWRYALTGLLMGLPSLIISKSFYCVIPCLTHTLFGYISLKNNRFKWAYVAIIQGLAIGICYTLSVN